MKNFVNSLFGMRAPFFGIVFLAILIFFGSSCSSPTHPGITAKDVTGLHLASDSAWQTFERSVPDSTLGTHCDGTKYMKATCDTKLDSVGYVKQGPLADPDSLAKALNEIAYGQTNQAYGLSAIGNWMSSHAHLDDLLKFLLAVLLVILVALLSALLLDRFLGGGQGAHILRHVHQLVEGQNTMRTFLHERLPANQAPPVRIPTPDSSVTSVTTSHSHAPETIDVTDGTIRLRMSADRIHHPIIVTSVNKEADGKETVRTLTVGAGKYQTPADAGSTPTAPPAPAAPAAS